MTCKFIYNPAPKFLIAARAERQDNRFNAELQQPAGRLTLSTRIAYCEFVSGEV